MLKEAIQKHAFNCGLSKRLQKKTSIIIEILEECSSGLSAAKHGQLIEIMKLKICNPDDLMVQKNITNDIRKWTNDDLSKMIKFIGTYFHLVNQAELDEIIFINAERDKISNHTKPKIDSIAYGVKYLHENSIDFDKAFSILKSININSTFTAHPTETKRNSLIDKQRRILLLVEKLLDNNFDQKEKLKIKFKALKLCKLVLLTDDVRNHQVSINEEIENVIKNTSNSLWHAVPLLVEDLENAFYNYYNKKINLHEFLNFQTWVGGDRDGNPNVTFEISKSAIVSLINHLILMYNNDLNNLFNDFSISIKHPEENCRLVKSISKDLKKSKLPKEIRARYQFEPVRMKLLLIKEKLTCYRDSIRQLKKPELTLEHFQRDLEILSDFLEQLSKDKSLVFGGVKKLLIRSKVFGLHFMGLDIRQHSSVHEKAANEIISFIFPKFNYLDASERERCKILKQLILSKNINFDKEIKKSSKLLEEVLGTFTLIKNSMRINKKIISSYIISMTDSKSDILEVIFLGRVTGLIKYKNKKISTWLKIVPLYETISDLQNAPKLLEELINDNVYNLFLCNHLKFQEIMLGYSDSNKDGGFGMANYSLNQCLKEIGQTLRKYNIDFRIFHGRGGSISRGGGKSNKAILSLPRVSQNGKIRFTEQGEVINYRYGSYQIAKRHLEQILSAQMISLTKPIIEPSNKELIRKVMETSHDHYKKNILNKKCWQFLTKSSPINHISKIPITSRPASRNKTEEGNYGFKDLRAIPWVFSWTQIRYNISGWFGMGHALNIINDDPKLFNQLKLLSKKSAFFSQLLDNMSFEMARMRIHVSSLYANTNQEREFCKLIEKDYTLATSAYKKITGYKSLLERNKVISSSIQHRNPFTDMLNYAQIELLKRCQNSKNQIDDIDTIIFSSINHLAAAMQTSG
ncbi:MAG: phosphoenolpyruvate carboxylase [Candidatus Neomarinimicrobiota bacterium]